MSAEVFLDTNILIYALVQNDARAARASLLLRQGGTISVQVLNEFTNTALRKFKRPWTEIIEALAALRVLFPDPRPIDPVTHEAALTIAQREGFSFYDSLIVASALEAQCSTLLSEDMQNGRVVEGRMTIRNPFLSAST
jgi:predicted nucleic acid-binding protein